MSWSCLSVAVAVQCWGEDSHDPPILLHTDNMPVVHVWTMGTCKWPHLMSLVRRLFFFLAQRSVNLLLGHVPGCKNINADMLSRLQVAEFRSRRMRDTAHTDDGSISRLGVAATTTSTAGKLIAWLPARPGFTGQG